MGADSLYSFPALMSSLPQVLGVLRSRASAIGPDALLRAETALEELLTNTVLHGRAGADPSARIWIGVEVSGTVCTLCYQDMREAFDPAPRIAEAQARTQNPLDQRPPGGLGLLMVHRMADAMRYQRVDGRNCIELSFSRRDPGAPAEAPPS